MQRTITLTALVISLGLVCGPLSAQELARLPTQIDANGTAYISGGIGDMEFRQISQAGQDFNLKLILSEKSGAFVANVVVAIFNRQGKQVLDVPAGGPIVLTRLAPGAYRVRATYEGREMQKNVNIRAGAPQTISIAW